MIHLLSKKHKFCHDKNETRIISTRSTNYRKIATSMFEHDATTFKLSINRIIHKPWGKFSFVRSREITPSFCLGQGVRSGVSSRRGRVSTRKLYRPPMMHRPEMAKVVPGRKCATYVQHPWPRARVRAPLPAHKYVATSTSFLPIYFVPRISMVERIFQIFEKGEGER